MYINYNIVDGHEYATVTSSVRKGNKIFKGDSTYLGRVIDKEKHIFKNKERGLFVYDIGTNTYSKVPPEYQEPRIERKRKIPKRQLLSVPFGNVYLLDCFIREFDFYKVIDATKFRNLDTLHALLFYYILSSKSNIYAKDWWNGSYARYLFPKAQLASQRISDALADLGTEDAKRSFFKEYLNYLRASGLLSEDKDAKDDNEVEFDDTLLTNGILIDSTGLPNDNHLPITAVSNHNGVISNEIRLIYTVQQNTGLPLFFRYVSGNSVDVATLSHTIAELKANGINTKFAITDAGYYSGKNADELFEAKISFLCRMRANSKIYREIVKEHVKTLDSDENLVKHNGRICFIKHVECKIGSKNDHAAHAYLCRDSVTKRQEESTADSRAWDEDLAPKEIMEDRETHGIFILVSSRRIAKEKLLPLYYMRDLIEKVFRLCKQTAKILPLNIEKEATLRGHLLMCFIAAIVLKKMMGKLVTTKLTIENVLDSLRDHHVIIYDNELITTEARPDLKRMYEAFGFSYPIAIPRQNPSVD